MGKLTAAQVKHAKPGRHGDGRGLYLQVIGGSKTWVLRYEHNKRERWMGLGSVEFVSLAQARESPFQRAGFSPSRKPMLLANSNTASICSRSCWKHHPALPYAELPGFMAELRALPGIAARALEFTILTVSRTGEARFARWGEFEASAGVWTVPGERMKGDKDHRAPYLIARWRSSRASA